MNFLSLHPPAGILAAVALSCMPVAAQSPHVGMYVGDLTIQLSGPFNSGPTPSGRMIFNVFPDGTVAEIGGDPVGTVDESGAIIWQQPNTFNFSTGSISNGALISQSSTTENTLTRTLRIEAQLLGGAFPAGQTFTNQLLDLAPVNGYRDHTQVIAANGGFIAVGRTGTVALSGDGLDWRRSAAPTARDLNAVAFGNGTYLAVGEHGTLLTSSDGVNWVPRNTPFQFNLGITGVAFGDGKFVIASQFSNVATSTDGVAWNVAPTALASFIPGKIRYMNGQFVYWHGGNIRFSNDAVTWSAPVNLGAGINDVTHGDGLWVAATDGGIRTSVDGVSWTTVSSLTLVRTIGYGNGRFVANVAGSQGAVYYAAGAGATQWRRANASNGSQSVAFDGTRFVMVGPQIITSVDGVSWQPVMKDSRATGATPQRVFTNTDGTRTIIDVWKSAIYETTGNSLWVGPRGQAYLDTFQLKTPVDTETDADLHAIAGKFVGGDGGVIRKVDLVFLNPGYDVAVTQVNSPTTANLRGGLGFGANTLMVGDGGTIVRFSGVATATMEASGTTEDLRYVGYVSTNNNTQLPPLVMAVGDNGTMLVYNGTSWVPRNTGTTANLIGVGYITIGFSNNTNARYVAVGEDGTVITSVDSITWVEENPIRTPVPLETFSNTQEQFGYKIRVGGAGYSALLEVTSADTQIFVTGGNTSLAGQFTAARIAHGGGRYVKVQGDRVYASLDGREWQSRLTLGNLRDVTYGKGVFVAAGGPVPGQTEADRIWFSYDGLDWQPATHAATNRVIEAVTYLNGRFFALGRFGTVFGSDNGIDWELIQADLTASERRINAVASGNGMIVGVGSDAGGSRRFVMSSVDGGETWAQRADLSGGRFTSVAYGNGTFVVVGLDNIRYSTDGINFTSGKNFTFNDSSSGSAPNFDHVFFANGVFVATTGMGQAYVSSNGMTWQERFTGLRGAITGSTVANGQVVLVASDKVIALAGEDTGSPYVIQQPQSGNVEPGGTLQLNATATGEGPLQYQWTRNGQPLEDDGRISGAATLNLQITGVSPADAGQYRLAVTNDLGGRTSRAAEITVIARPVIVIQPQSVEVAPNASATLSVEAEGDSLSYQWFKNGLILPGETESSLTLNSIQAADVGIYRVSASNIAGFVFSRQAAVSISLPEGGPGDSPELAIIAGSKSRGFGDGDEVLLTVAAIGVNLSYQWFKDDALLPDEAGMTLLLSNMTEASAGVYRVEVSDGVDMVPSANIVLTYGAFTPVPEIRVEHPVGNPLFNQEAIAFGSGYIGQPVQRTITILNVGDADLTELVVSVSGANASEFVAGALGATEVAPGNSTTFVVTFSPSAEGERSAMLEIASDDPENHPFVISLSGTGTLPPTPPSIDTDPESQVVTAPNPATFTVAASGFGVSYQWQIRTSPSGAWEDIPNANTATTQTAETSFAMNGYQYRCRVFNDFGEVFSVPAGLTVELEPLAPTQLAVGGPLNLDLDLLDRRVLSVRGLPRGLRFDARNQTITGIPTAPNRGGVPYVVLAQLLRSDGTRVTEQWVFDVEPFPTWLAAKYQGFVEIPDVPDASDPLGMGGMIDLQVSANGTYSARLILGGRTFATRGAVEGFVGQNDPAAEIAITQTIATVRNDPSKDLVVDLRFTQAESGYGALTGEIRNATEESGSGVEVRGWPNPWNARTNPAIGGVKQAMVNTVFHAVSEPGAGSEFPGGSGFAQVILRSTGLAVVRGVLADGERFSGNALISTDGECFVYRPIYRKSGAGLLFMQLDDVNDSSTGLEGEFDWVKPAILRTPSYPDGFGLRLQVTGRAYVPPAAGVYLFDESSTPPQGLTLRLDGLEVGSNPQLAAFASMDLETVQIPLILAPRNRIAVDPATGLKMKLSVNAKTGLFSGATVLPRALDDGRNARVGLRFWGIYLPSAPGVGGHIHGFFSQPVITPAAVTKQLESGQLTIDVDVIPD